MILVGILAVLVGGGTFVGGLLAAPIDFAVPPPAKSALLLAADGRTQFATIRPPERRDIVPAKDIPQVMRRAIISAEDERFLEHKGVDPLATIRAAYRDLTGSKTQGGSTLTQQYVKNVYVGNERTALRKVKEAALAVRLENRLSKDQILTDYLNALYLGNGVYGVQAASRYYFGVDVKNLDLDKKRNARDPNLALARASMLAGIAPAPSAWTPVKDFPTARARQRYTLNQMIKIGFVTSGDASSAFTRRSAVIPVKEQPPELPTNAPEFTDLMQAQLKGKFSGEKEDVLFRGGLRVKTTLDADLQEAASRALREVIPDDDMPQGAVAAIDIRNGDVRAMTTLRRDPEKKQFEYQRNGLNLTTSAFRSTGSTIKPFTLAVALQEGHSLGERRYGPQCNHIPDASEDDGYYDPCNAGDSESGTFSLRKALALSVNTIYIPLANEVGRTKIRDLMLKAGVKVDVDAQGKPRFSAAPKSFGLGTTAEVSPLSLANAYASLVNHGVHTEPRYFSDIKATDETAPAASLKEFVPKVQRRRVLPSEVADEVTEAMEDVVTYGTGVDARQPFPVYGKTGTTNEARDAWFVGCARAPQYVCIATWMGYEDHRSMHDIAGVRGLVYGGTLPAKVFARTFEILREIQADRAGRLSGNTPEVKASSEPSPSPTRRRRRRPRATVAPAQASPRPARTAQASPAPKPQDSPQPPPIIPSPAAAASP
ncbi:MAG: penicillin-binding protein [Actinobacteria bacterium]|nr:penicillin-binding protein [Actinomycetota bacterium]